MTHSPTTKTFDFTSALLTRDEAAFTRSAERESVLKKSLGESVATVSLRSVSGELRDNGIRSDLRLLPFVERALAFVHEIRAGDPIPSEIVDGRPSWEPKREFVDRALTTIAAGLRLSEEDCAGKSSGGTGIANEITRRFLTGTAVSDHQKAQRAQDALNVAIRAIHLNDSILEAQRILGQMATAVSRSADLPDPDRLRDTALHLRQPITWASREGIKLNLAAADIRSLTRDQDFMPTQVWPRINALRCWWIDIDPILRLWKSANAHRGELRARDLEPIYRLTFIRYHRFDPGMFAEEQAGEPPARVGSRD